MVMKVVPLQPMEVHGGVNILPKIHGGPHIRAGRYTLKEAVTPWKAHARSGFLVGPVNLWGTRAAAVRS